MRCSRLGGISLALLAMLAAASVAKAQLLIGGFQGAGDPTDAGWVNVNTGDPITADAPFSTFVAAGVPGYPLSLQEAAPNNVASFGSPSQLELQFSPAQIAAFNANTWMTFTFSTPTGAATSGYDQIYNLAFNAQGYGYNNLCSGSNAAATWGALSQAMGNTGNNQNGMPNFYMYAGDPALDTQTVTVNYSSILPAIIAGGEGYVQMTFQGNTSGTNAVPLYQDFNNVVLSTAPFGVDAAVPEPVSASLIGLGSLGLLARRRSKAAK
jgi:hypothetical protein